MWDTVLAVNLSGTFYFCREFLLRLDEGQAASIYQASPAKGIFLPADRPDATNFIVRKGNLRASRTTPTRL